MAQLAFDADQMKAEIPVTARPISSLCTWDNMIEAVEEYGITSMFCPPTVCIGILRSEGFDPNRLGTVTKGLLRRVDHAGGDGQGTVLGVARDAALELLRPDRDRSAGNGSPAA